MLPLASIVIALILTSAGRAEAGGDSFAVSPATITRPPAPAPWPSTVQVGAPSINSASPDLVDHAGFPALAGVA